MAKTRSLRRVRLGAAVIGWLAVVLLVAWLVLATRPAAAAESRLSLHDAMQLVLHNRTEMAQSEIDIKRAQLEHLRAWLQRAQLHIEAGFTEQYQRNGLFLNCAQTESLGLDCRNESHEFNTMASLTVPVWSGLGVEASIARARALRHGAEAQQKVTARQLMLEAMNAYWAVRRAELQLNVARDALHRNQEVATLTNLKFKHNVASYVDFTRAQTLVSKQQALIAQLEAQVGAARAQLGAALQLDDSLVLVEDPAAHLPRARAALGGGERVERPELVALGAQVEAARQGVRVAQSAFWPQLNLVGQFSLQSQPLLAGNAANPTAQEDHMVGNFVVGAQLKWTIFDNLTTWANAKDAKYLHERAALDLERERYTIKAEVTTARVQLQKALERRTAIDAAVGTTRTSRDLIKQRYSSGAAILIEVLDVESELTEVLTQQLDNTIDIAIAQATYDSVLGKAIE